MKKPTFSFNLIEIFKSKRMRFGGYAALVTLAAVVVLVIVNLIFQQLPIEVDMTENRFFSLSDQTIDLLDSLENEVVIYAVYSPGRESPNVIDVLNKYVRASKKIRLEYIDPDKSPMFLRKYENEETNLNNGTLIFESGDIFKVIPSVDLYDVSYSQQGEAQVMGFKGEQRFTSALLYVTSGVTPKIYVLQGHREYTLLKLGIQSTVEKENYAVEELDLIKTPDVPEDADIVLILSPEFDLTQREADALATYLENDGSAMFFFDYAAETYPLFNELLGSYGVNIGEGIVMERDRNHLYSPDNPLWIAPELLPHEINDPLISSSLTVLMPNSIPVKTLDIVKRNVIIEPLVQTSDNSWARIDIENTSMLKLDSDIDGPVDVVVAISKQKSDMREPEGYRMIVAGNAGFVGPLPYIGNLKPNLDFFLNGLSWLNKRTDSISIRSKSLFEFPLRISATMQLIYAGILVILIPLGILITGLVVWLRRRHL
jgi:ABC-2 type transport system permease protein